MRNCRWYYIVLDDVYLKDLPKIKDVFVHHTANRYRVKRNVNGFLWTSNLKKTKECAIVIYLLTNSEKQNLVKNVVSDILLDWEKVK